jgi:hypothetical protein
MSCAGCILGYNNDYLLRLRSTRFLTCACVFLLCAKSSFPLSTTRILLLVGCFATRFASVLSSADKYSTLMARSDERCRRVMRFNCSSGWHFRCISNPGTPTILRTSLPERQRLQECFPSTYFLFTRISRRIHSIGRFIVILWQTPSKPRSLLCFSIFTKLRKTSVKSGISVVISQQLWMLLMLM